MMYSSVIFLLFISFALLYNLSKKASWGDKPDWASQLASRSGLSLALSFSLMTLGCMLMVLLNGVGSGLFSFVVIMMCIASITVLLFPLRYLSLIHLFILYVLLLSLENIFYYAG